MPLDSTAVLGRKNNVVCCCGVLYFTLNFSITGISENDRGLVFEGRLAA